MTEMEQYIQAEREPYAQRLAEIERMQVQRMAEYALARSIGEHVAVGWRVESQTPTTAVLVTGGVNHILHLLLTFFTLGLWVLVWLLLIVVDQPRRLILTIAPDGSVVSSGSRQNT